MQPRLIRLNDAPSYCGMAETFFNSRIRPLIEIEIIDGSKFTAFDRLDLDIAIDEYKRRNGKPKEQESDKCQKDHQVCNSTKQQKRGASIKESTKKGSGSVYKLALNKKQK